MYKAPDLHNIPFLDNITLEKSIFIKKPIIFGPLDDVAEDEKQPRYWVLDKRKWKS